MRNLFFAFVLANLAFAAWRAWFAEPASEPAPRAESPREITLASEAIDEGIELAEEPPDVPADRPNGVPDEPAFAEREAGDAAAGAGGAGGPGESEASAGDDSSRAGAEAESRAADAGPARPQTDASAARPDGAAASEAIELACVSVGPFRELSQAAAAGATLREQGFEPIQRAREGDIWVGYWIYIEQIPSVAEANEILALLRENGIADSYVIPSSDSGTLVSLGVFSELTRAGRRREEVRALGLEATISDRTRRATVYWVDVMMPRGDTLDFEQLQPPGRIVRLEQRPCESVPN